MVLFIILGAVVLTAFIVLGVLSFLLSQEEQKEKAVLVTDFSQLKEKLSSQKQFSLEDEAYKKRAQALENELLTFSKEADGRSNEAKQTIETLTKENESLKSKQSDLEYELIKARAQSSGLERVNFNYKNQLEGFKARLQQQNQ
jgi:FtsZ-binding cell division protein ZapB